MNSSTSPGGTARVELLRRSNRSFSSFFFSQIGFDDAGTSILHISYPIDDAAVAQLPHAELALRYQTSDIARMALVLPCQIHKVEPHTVQSAPSRSG